MRLTLTIAISPIETEEELANHNAWRSPDIQSTTKADVVNHRNRHPPTPWARSAMAPLNVDPRHSIARDERPLRVRPKSARRSTATMITALDWAGFSRSRCSCRAQQQLSPYRRDGRHLAQTRPPSSVRQRRVLNLLDQARPSFGERPVDRPPL
jgi:hypothetical protein